MGCRSPLRSQGDGIFERGFRRWALSLFVLTFGCGAGRVPVLSTVPPASPASESLKHFSVMGDLQGTLVWERIFGREDNAAERKLLVPEMAQARPAFVVLLGDLVTWGNSAQRWAEFDEQTQSLRDGGIPVLPVPGNHDYFGGGKLRRYFARFPGLHRRHWYERRYGGLALLLLDSNAGPLSRQQWQAQRCWFEQRLQWLDAEASVQGVLVFLHHTPLTNSTNVGDNMDVARDLLQPFLRAQKTMALFAGHAHGYERFPAGAKAIVVSAGGGGPRTELLKGDARRHPDDQARLPSPRPFNFVEVGVTASGLHAEVVGLKKGERTFCRLDHFDLRWPGVQRAAPRSPPSPRSVLPTCE
jgi:Calcineurin-like phosphoesterase